MEYTSIITLFINLISETTQAVLLMYMITIIANQYEILDINAITCLIISYS